MFGTEFHNWIDVPTIRELEHISKFSPSSDLAFELKNYHQIPKNRKDTLTVRIVKLSQLAYRCTAAIVTSPMDREVLANIAKTATNKGAYLDQLRQLYASGILLEDERVYDASKIAGYFHEFSNPKYSPIVMNNSIFYNSSIGLLWGEFWLETIDPGHRQLDSLKHKWLNDLSHTNKPPFFLWLEDQWIDPSTAINYLTVDEQRNAQLLVKDGKIFKNAAAESLTAITTYSHEEFIFVITAQAELLGTRSDKLTRHVSLSHGKAIIGAGIMHVEEGQLIGLESNSGHYLPSEEDGLQLINALKDLGVKFPDEIPFSFFRDLKKQKTTVRQFNKGRRPHRKPGALPPATPSAS